MELNHAIEIVRYLAAGMNPLTGRSLDCPGCVCDEEVLSALRAVLRKASSAKQGATQKNEDGDVADKPAEKQHPLAHGTSWTFSDDAELQKMFRDGLSLSEISTAMQRSSKGVASRLRKLGVEYKWRLEHEQQNEEVDE